MADIWVLAETRDGTVQKVTYELLDGRPRRWPQASRSRRYWPATA